MTKRRAIALSLVIALVGPVALGVGSEEAMPPVRLLVVDETKTFASTMLVAGLVGALRAAEMFVVDVELVEVASSFDDPLAGSALEEGTAPYDVIVIVPRGLDDGTVRQIWIVSDGFASLPPFLQEAVAVASGIVDTVFAGFGEATDVTEDLWPALLWAGYAATGWIR